MKMLLLTHPSIEHAFDGWRNCLGQDFAGYRNHVYRVFNLAVWISSASGEEIEEIAIAAAFHDIGIWLAQTFDYLDPLINALRCCLEQSGRSQQFPLIAAMVLQHHKVTPWHGPGRHLVEAFRRADWLDAGPSPIDSALFQKAKRPSEGTRPFACRSDGIPISRGSRPVPPCR